MTILITQPAPDFTAPAVLGTGEIIENFSLSKTIKNKYALVFFIHSTLRSSAHLNSLPSIIV